MTPEDVADAMTEHEMTFTPAMIREIRPVWDEGGILAQCDMMQGMWIAALEQNKGN